MELDADLRLTEHCPKLAAMLLRGGFSTQGAPSMSAGGSGSSSGGGGDGLFFCNPRCVILLDH